MVEGTKWPLVSFATFTSTRRLHRTAGGGLPVALQMPLLVHLRAEALPEDNATVT
uniref:Uncharacterized protein n=1 Tax=Anguilla anguilla TaxID=7936 RepID=A0A0E9WRB4_ANGAN